MNYIAPRAEPLIRDIPLSRLPLAPENVRKTGPDRRTDAELKASIAALGLLENLIVRMDTPNEDPGSREPAPAREPGRKAAAERYAVAADGRRRKAIRALVEDGVIDPDHPVPCLVRANDGEAGEVSRDENFVRIVMHPADQVAAFTKLAETGQSVSSIAARFGLSERLVRQRLRPETAPGTSAFPRGAATAGALSGVATDPAPPARGAQAPSRARHAARAPRVGWTTGSEPRPMSAPNAQKE